MEKKNKLGGVNYILVMEGSNTLNDERNIHSIKYINDSIWRARFYQSYYGIPNSRCFSTALRDIFPSNLLKAQGQSPYNAFKPGALRDVRIFDKIWIVGHGDPRVIGNLGSFTSEKLFQMLSYTGLGQVGLISFEGCNVGQLNFLESLADLLDNSPIQFGWVKAYMGFSGLLYRYRPKYIVSDTLRQTSEHLMLLGPPISENPHYQVRYRGKQAIYKNGRVKIVRSRNCPFIGQSFGRYHGKPPPEILE